MLCALLRLRPQLASLSYLIFVAPLARFAVAKIELFLNTIQIKNKSRAQVSLDKGIRKEGARQRQRLEWAYITARGWDEGPPKRIGAASRGKMSELLYSSRGTYI